MAGIGRLGLAALLLAGCTTTDPIYCTPDETMCHGSCSPLYKDPINCGACDVACHPGEVCSEGACATSCGGGTTQCGQSCVDFLSDSSNCGACGNRCGPGLACSQGHCSSSCTAGMLCTTQILAYCALTGTDNDNCGGCGIRCTALEACIGGECVSACDESQTLCVSNTNTSYCTDTRSDPANCGACLEECPSNAYCAASECECPAAYTLCGAACVDLSTDTYNCGGCGTKCDGVCNASECSTDIDYLGKNAGGPLVVQSGYAYLLDSASNLSRVATNGTSPALLAASTSTTSLAVDASYAYWPNGNAVGFVPISGGSVSSQPLPAGDIATSVVADGVSVYVAYEAGIVSFPSGGGTVTPLVSSESQPVSLVVAGGLLLWTNASYELRSVTTAGNGLATITTMPGPIGAVASDGTNAYFTVGGSELLVVPTNGSTPALLLASGLSSVVAIVTDGTSVYWIDATSISKKPVGGGPTTSLVATGGDANDLALDSESLYWTSSSSVTKMSPK